MSFAVLAGVVAVVCFAVASVGGQSSKVNLTALGLTFFAISWLATLI